MGMVAQGHDKQSESGLGATVKQVGDGLSHYNQQLS